MLSDIIWAALFVAACIAFYRFGIPRFKQFDAENVARARQQELDKADPSAHFRHALEVADEQVEAVSEIVTGGVTRYLFAAQMYDARGDAEEARANRVGVIARRFYAELPQALAGSNARATMSARERASRRWQPRGDN